MKELEDFNAFPAEFFCSSLSEELQVLMGAALMTDDDAQLAISSDLADLLSIQQASNPDLTSEELSCLLLEPNSRTSLIQTMSNVNTLFLMPQGELNLSICQQSIAMPLL